MKRHAFVTPVALALTLAAADAPAQTTVVRADHMLDVQAGRVVDGAVVVIEGDRIEEVGPAVPPAGARVIDLGDLTLVPGLIDLHTHLGYDLEGDWVHRPVKETAADVALRGARNARWTLLAGFTTVRDVASTGFADVALMRAIDAGLIDGPRIVPAGHAIGITGGHCDVTGFAPGILEQGPEAGVADGVDEVIKAVRYQIKHGARVIKVCATAGVLSFEGPVGAQQMSDAELRAAVEEAARHGLKVAAHAHGTEGIIAAARAGVASIEHGSMLNDEAIRVMKEHGTYLVPTVFQWYLDYDLPPAIKAKDDYMRSFVDASVRAAIRAGVKIGFGTDAGVYRHGMNAREFAALVERGMSPIEAIRAATLYAADLLGVDDRGVIAPGRLADLIAVDGDPLQNVRVLEDVKFVMKGGVVYKAPPGVAAVHRN
jgi:imidazolonepropionase-like amidohydrolase